MNASEINAEFGKIVSRAIREGISSNKVGFETVVGIIESHKHALFEWRMAMMAQQEAARIEAESTASASIILDRNGGKRS